MIAMLLVYRDKLYEDGEEPHSEPDVQWAREWWLHLTSLPELMGTGATSSAMPAHLPLGRARLPHEDVLDTAAEEWVEQQVRQHHDLQAQETDERGAKRDLMGTERSEDDKQKDASRRYQMWEDWVMFDSLSTSGRLRRRLLLDRRPCILEGEFGLFDPAYRGA